MAARIKETASEPKETERKFSKAQLLKAEQYRHQQDLLSALLEDRKTYSIKEVGKRIKDFLEKEM